MIWTSDMPWTSEDEELERKYFTEWHPIYNNYDEGMFSDDD